MWSLISETKHRDWLLLTKRPQDITDMIPWSDKTSLRGTSAHASFWMHLWLGTSVANQQLANERIGHLCLALAALKFLSCEPLLDSLDLSPWLGRDREDELSDYDGADRVIGGESGGKARPCHTADVRLAVEQCRETSISCFV